MHRRNERSRILATSHHCDKAQLGFRSLRMMSLKEIYKGMKKRLSGKDITGSDLSCNLPVCQRFMQAVQPNFTRLILSKERRDIRLLVYSIRKFHVTGVSGILGESEVALVVDRRH